MAYLETLHDHAINQAQFSVIFITNVLCCLALGITVMFFAFNIRYRNFRLIKMSSPNINNIINFNCMLLYLCPILNGIKGMYIYDERIAGLMCVLNQWLIPICSTAVYTAMLAKAWRIYKIFDNSPKMKKIVIKDYQLVIYIACMCLVDVVVLVLWQTLDGVEIKPRFVYETKKKASRVIMPFSYVHYTKSHNLSDLLNRTVQAKVADEAPIVQNFTHTNNLKVIYECSSNFQEVWMTSLTMYKIILLMYGIYLAWLIRNVNVPSMNDSKYLFLSTYAVIICGLGSLTLTQLLKNWPDVVQVFFTLGLLMATCTTQCLVFIPKIRLWYKRRNDDNFKISLSQIFLNSSTRCYFSGKHKASRSKSINNTNVLNLEDELCALLHENSQLKKYLKEKEEIIKLLQDKVRIAKTSFFNASDTKNYTEIVNTQEFTTPESVKSEKNLIEKSESSTSENITTGGNKIIEEKLNVNNDLRYSVSDASSTAVKTTDTSMQYSMTNSIRPTQGFMQGFYSNPQNNYTEQLRNDLDEVEALTSRVRDSISVDLSNTRRYSPLLYEYYRKQLELAKSIQCTYNIQCNTLFDAMTLMRSCLKDYCQTVHNPEYLAIDAINVKTNSKTETVDATRQNQFSFIDYLAKNNSNITANQTYSLPQSSYDLTSNIQAQQFSQNTATNIIPGFKSVNSLNSNNKRNLKEILLNKNSSSMKDQKNSDLLDNTILTNLSSNQNTSVESTSSNLSSSSASSFSATTSNKNSQSLTFTTSDKQASSVQVIDNKQTYV